MIIELEKKKTNYYFFLNNKIFKTPIGNEIYIESYKVAIKLLKYLDLCLNKNNKERSFFLEILYFNYDLNKENKKNFIKKTINYLNTDLLFYRADKNTELEKIQKKKMGSFIIFFGVLI